MSFVNVVCGFIAPSYPAVYMIESEVMKEAEKRGAVFDGVVAKLDEAGPTYMTTTFSGANNALDTDESSIIRYRHFRPPMNGDVFRGYFFYLKRSIPFIRLIKYPIRYWNNRSSSSNPNHKDDLNQPNDQKKPFEDLNPVEQSNESLAKTESSESALFAERT
ncbi:hypothetical protein BDD12DRAFT_888907 [Trichophaea hybrida]|nr:hypothetical protein BDD12DRAFT_888907 [Trichophaea hybrida]